MFKTLFPNREIGFSFSLLLLFISISCNESEPTLSGKDHEEIQSDEIIEALDTLILQTFKPNVVLVMADDMGLETWNCYGGQSYETPNLTKLSSLGMRFDRVYSNPMCTPSRVKIMTGEYGIRNYIKFATLGGNENTFGHLFKQNGYKTAIAGKWQLGNDFPDLSHFGFDEHFLWSYLGNQGSRYFKPKFIKNNEVFNGETEEYGPDLVLNFFKEFIAENKKESFFFYYPALLPHSPFGRTPHSTEEFEDKTKYFPDMVEYFDFIVGEIYNSLSEKGLLENTLIIITSDNGTAQKITSQYNDQSYQGGKGKTTSNGSHVPLIAIWANTIRPGSVSKEIIDFSDFYSTFAHLLNDKTSEKFDGQSFLPQFFNNYSNTRKLGYIYFNPRHQTNHTNKVYAFDEKYKLYTNGEFYDYISDPNEKSILRNLTNNQSSVKNSLKQRLDSINNNPNNLNTL